VPRRPSTHVDDPAAVGARIRAARLEAGLKQRELTFDGCTPAYLSRVEAGQRIPSLQILTRLAERLGTNVALVPPELIAPYREFLEYSDMGAMLGIVRAEAESAPPPRPGRSPVRRAARAVRSTLRR